MRVEGRGSKGRVEGEGGRGESRGGRVEGRGRKSERNGGGYERGWDVRWLMEWGGVGGWRNPATNTYFMSIIIQ